MKTKSFDDYLATRFSSEKIKSIKEQSELEFKALQSLQNDLSKSLEQYMQDENIGFNELVARLGSSPSQIRKIQLGQANITLATIAHIAGLLKKNPSITFK